MTQRLSQLDIPNPPILQHNRVGLGNEQQFIGNLVSRFIVFAIIAAGLYFFFRLLSAGYTYLTSLGEPAKIQAATKELTNAAIGLIVVISAFFIAQILQIVFGIKII